jgi:glycosyltransferase involved in cell wall biosynthesis
MVVPAPMRRLSSHTFALESAFGEHLRVMIKALQPRFSELVIAAPEFSAKDYGPWRTAFTTVDERKEPLRFEKLYDWGGSRIRFWARELAPALLRARKLVAEADLVHSHLSFDVYRPIEFQAALIAAAMKKPLLTITDIDNRKSAEMNYKAGKWSWREYAVCKYVYDPLRDLQQHAYVKLSDLVLMKEPQQVEDFGKGAEHVRFFQDPNFTAGDVVPPAELAKKVAHLEDDTKPLRVMYFGRYVPYKGVDRMIEAVAYARAHGANLTFDLMGNGDEEPRLKKLVADAGIGDIVDWLPTRAYGAPLFEVLRERDLLLACPLTPDTPRSTWDAIASGMSVLAFDTPFYVGMGKKTGAVETVPWPDARAMGEKLLDMARNKKRLVPVVQRAAQIARDNPHEAWLQRRIDWLFEMMDHQPR